MAGSIFTDMKRYPVIFIGSGMSKRFLANYPTWTELLEVYWDKIDQDIQFYNYLLKLRKDHEPYVPEDELEHKINTEAAEFIENHYNDMFNEGKIPIEGLTPRRVYEESISPFKYSICQQFSKYTLREDVDLEEYEAFKLFLKKSKIIITTNYDPFIENILREEGVTLRKYIGSRGFFDDTEGWSELYKIHGDVSEPNSIVITQKDYEEYDKNSILISAKILSNLIVAPIIFLGYSLTDRNIRKLLQDFSSQFPKEDDRKSAQRIILIARAKGKRKAKEVHSSDFGVSYVKVETDNYESIFTTIGEIDEGLSPSEILRYKSLIKNLIIQEGGSGNLNNILVSPSDLDTLESDLKSGKNLVVALGNERLVYTNIKEDSYIEEYFSEVSSISPKLAIDFIADTMPSQRIPFCKYLSADLSSLSSRHRNRVNARIAAHGKLEGVLSKVSLDQETSRESFSRVRDIEERGFSQTKEVGVIVKNIKSINIDDVGLYIKNKAIQMFISPSCLPTLKTEIRKLFCAYDLLKYGEPGKIA